jgi:hypothetical protein
VAEETVAHTLASMTTDELLGVLDQVGGTEKQKTTDLASLIMAMPTLPLLAKNLPKSFKVE